jgi:hypothetical protein
LCLGATGWWVQRSVEQWHDADSRWSQSHAEEWHHHLRLDGATLCSGSRWVNGQILSFPCRSVLSGRHTLTHCLPGNGWLQGDALDPSTYAGVLDGAKIVVSTIGTLIENDSYKRVLRSVSFRLPFAQ